MTKDELRRELERQSERYQNLYGGDILTYAAQPTPDRKPWRKKASVQDKAFERELKKMEEAQKEADPQTAED